MINYTIAFKFTENEETKTIEVPVDIFIIQEGNLKQHPPNKLEFDFKVRGFIFSDEAKTLFIEAIKRVFETTDPIEHLRFEILRRNEK